MKYNKNITKAKKETIYYGWSFLLITVIGIIGMYFSTNTIQLILLIIIYFGGLLIFSLIFIINLIIELIKIR